jgi:hypothetical protein
MRDSAYHVMRASAPGPFGCAADAPGRAAGAASAAAAAMLRGSMCGPGPVALLGDVPGFAAAKEVRSLRGRSSAAGGDPWPEGPARDARGVQQQRPGRPTLACVCCCAVAAPAQAFLELGATWALSDSASFGGRGGSPFGSPFGGGGGGAPDKWLERVRSRKPATAADVDAAVGRLAGALATHGIRIPFARRACGGPGVVARGRARGRVTRRGRRRSCTGKTNVAAQRPSCGHWNG